MYRQNAVNVYTVLCQSHTFQCRPFHCCRYFLVYYIDCYKGVGKNSHMSKIDLNLIGKWNEILHLTTHNSTLILVLTCHHCHTHFLHKFPTITKLGQKIKHKWHNIPTQARLASETSKITLDFHTFTHHLSFLQHKLCVFKSRTD